MTVTFVDAGVLIAAYRGAPSLQRNALDVLEAPDRTFVANTFLRLKLLPKALYHRNTAEIAFYEAFFAQVVAWAEPVERVVAVAHQEASQHGLNALDALHVAAGRVYGADELVTTEGPGKPIHRVTSIRVVGI